MTGLFTESMATLMTDVSLANLGACATMPIFGGAMGAASSDFRAPSEWMTNDCTCCSFLLPLLASASASYFSWAVRASRSA